jgi:hypothetical protein
MSLSQFVDKPLHPMTPVEAYNYFKSIVPRLGVSDPEEFDKEQQQSAQDLALQVDKILLDKVKEIILSEMQGEGNKVGGLSSSQRIKKLLDDAGVGPTNSQYGDMVLRTNLMDAYNTGADHERQDPAVAGEFPVWRYVGIKDGRQRKTHEAHFDKYYDNSVSFAQVRDSLHNGEFSGFNCRCDQIPIHKSDWARLQSEGKKVTKLSSRHSEIRNIDLEEEHKKYVEKFGGKPTKWITVKGTHIPVEKGETKKKAVSAKMKKWMASHGVKEKKSQPVSDGSTHHKGGGGEKEFKNLHPFAIDNPNRMLPDSSRPPVPTKEIAQHLTNYSWGYDGPLNKILWETNKSPKGEIGEREDGKSGVDGKEMFNSIRGQIRKAKPFAKPVNVYRGIKVSGSIAKKLVEIAQQAKEHGGVLTMPGFISTSTDSKKAFWGKVQFRIKAVHGIDMSPYSEASYEDELLMDHNSRFRVVDVKPGIFRNYIYLEQLLPSSKEKPTGKLYANVENFVDTEEQGDNREGHSRMVGGHEEAQAWIRAMENLSSDNEGSEDHSEFTSDEIGSPAVLDSYALDSRHNYREVPSSAGHKCSNCRFAKNDTTFCSLFNREGLDPEISKGHVCDEWEQRRGE